MLAEDDDDNTPPARNLERERSGEQDGTFYLGQTRPILTKTNPTQSHFQVEQMR
jgi:hypothetical protein